MNLQSLVSFRNALVEYNFDYFIFGGWALDILNGKQTRDHLDADIVIWKEARETFLKFLKVNRCSVWDEGVKIVFANEFFNGEAMFLETEGGDCSFEGKYFTAKMPLNVLLPFSKSSIGNEEFSIGSRELIVKMTKQLVSNPSDAEVAKKLSQKCDKRIMDKIVLKRK